MRKGITKIMWITAILCVGLAPVQATLIAYDNFDYTLGTTVAAGGVLGGATNGFANAWKFNVYSGEIVNGLEFSGVASSGNALKITRNNTGGLIRGLNDPVPGTYYQSMIFYRNDLNTSSSENWKLELRHASSHASIDSSSVKYSVGSGSTELPIAAVTGGTIVTGAVAYAVGSPVFMLTKIVISDTGEDTVSMKFYNPGDTVPTSDSGIAWDATSTGEFVAGSGWKFILPANIPDMTIDEFRMGTVLVDVIPEPATYGMLSIGAMFVLLLRRMKR